ncbi:beta-galactosidase [Sphaerisporangium sp. TRM90804]|uniref:beta-galactosidase n=1 Tax=Sphaerisporangium sp. TRM90804 TaxID=3031113 RepID=UPI00244BB5D9|nr:beta-galactosidase [Sphaerisporangium sp. TRM90804]MDH2427034.1 beta-galactosidase [Sphaerisporangium sp. TRM90804]
MPGYPELPEGLAYGGDYNPEQWPEEIWHEDVRLMREAGVTLVSLGIFNWSLLEPAEGTYDFSALDRVIDLLHAGGVRIDLATPTSSPPAWFRRNHPGSRLVDREGHVTGGASRHGFCPSSPDYAAASERIARRLAERYGDHPAVAMWHVHNEYGWTNAQCYCETSAAAFRGWLRARYDGEVQRLNAAWGTTFWGLTYGSFEEVEPPRAGAVGQLTGLQLDYARFSVDAHLANFRREREAIRPHSDRPITTNFMIPACKPMDYWRWAGEVDVVANDHYLTAARPDGHIELAMAADLTRSVAGGRPWMLMEHSTGAVNWQPRNLAKRPGEMRRNSLTHVARGSDSVMFFQWRASRQGAEKFHSAMVPHAGTDSDLWRDVVGLGDDLRRLAGVRGSAVSAEVALLWDWESYWALELEWRPSVDLSYRERMEAYYEALWREHVTVDFAHPAGDVSGYRLVVAPSSYLLTEAAAKNLHRYVEAGGHLVVSYFSGIVDEHDVTHPGPYPGVLRDVLGVRVEEFHPLPEHGTVRLDGGEQGRVWSERVRPAGAEAVRAFATGPDAGHPAVTRHPLGAGSAWYVATALDGTAPASGLRELLGAVLDGAGVARRRDLPETVELVRRGAHTFVINHGDSPVTVPGVTGTAVLGGTGHGGTVTVPAGGVTVVRH